MITRRPSKRFIQARSGIKFFLIAEGFIFFSSFMLYAACNRSQKTRKYFNDSPYFKFVLDFYYKIGALHGNRRVEEYDKATWSNLGK